MPTQMFAAPERPIEIDANVMTRRIYSPQSYSLVRNAAIVPIVAPEAPRMATWFPVVWRRSGKEAQLVVLRALLPHQNAQPPKARALLPLMLSAYPFTLVRRDEDAIPMRMFDDVFADEPTDVGASVTNPDKKPSLGAQFRFKALDEFARQDDLTQRLTNDLAAADLLEPWKLSFEVEGGPITVDGLFIARQGAFETGQFAPLIARHGYAAVELLGYHRLSLYRAGILLTMARAFRKAGAQRQPDAPSSGRRQ